MWMPLGIFVPPGKNHQLLNASFWVTFGNQYVKGKSLEAGFRSNQNRDVGAVVTSCSQSIATHELLHLNTNSYKTLLLLMVLKNG
mmetsp:Transcript_149497/g.261224  ORF Transcript_149497/g.261224 Transcript_149497/m.261224 type:complete len:85 (+) Transcript_149497:437-691(+)